jgi:uncharacterized Zn-finger protein
MAMADHVVPHFHNEPGVPMIEIGAKEFMCVGALPPFDHPHIFLDMGDDNEIVCSYCSTLYRFNPSLKAHAARPKECVLPLAAA